LEVVELEGEKGRLLWTPLLCHYHRTRQYNATAAAAAAAAAVVIASVRQYGQGDLSLFLREMT